MSIAIRTADADDWSAIFPIFRSVMDAEETYTYPAGLSFDEARSVWMEDAPTRVVVAEVDSDIVGSAKFGPNRPGRGAHIGTASFIVDPGARGLGVGRCLGEHVIAACEQAGFAGIQFNAVVESNQPAVKLWTSLGFQIIGTVPGSFNHPTHGPVGLHIMYLPMRREMAP